MTSNADLQGKFYFKEKMSLIWLYMQIGRCTPEFKPVENHTNLSYRGSMKLEYR